MSTAAAATPPPTIRPQKPTPHHHHLFLNNPFSHADAYSDSPEETARPTTPGHNNGLRAQLHHLLPRHTSFHVRIHIHQITNIPLVSGEFCVRWKLKNVHAAPGSKSGLLNIVRSKSRAGTLGRRAGKEKGHEEEDDVDSLGSNDVSLTSSDDLPPLQVHSSTTASTTASTSTLSNHSPHTTTPFSATSATHPASILSPAPASATASSLAASAASSPARGQTPFVRLKDHNVTWEHAVDVVVRMDIERTTDLLLPSPLKLVVMQRVIPDDPGAPQNPRLGAVYLDLAQYAAAGEVQRRYLLRESKTNATLKITTHLEHLPGPGPEPVAFHAPPLPKGEILNGISGLLEHGIEDEVYRARPKGLDLYGPYHDQEELEMDLLGGAGGDSKGGGSGKRGEKTGHRGVNAKAGAQRAFDVERLPLAYGPKTTETLIEALFNPVRTSERRRESPFTLLVAPGEENVEPDPVPGDRLELGGVKLGLGIRVGVSGEAGMGGAGLGAIGGDMDGKGGMGVGKGKGGGKDGSKAKGRGAGSGGIGAGIGIMGLGMGMGIGMGVGVGVVGSGSSVGAGAGRQVDRGTSPQVDGIPRVNRKAIPAPVSGINRNIGRRQPSQGEASVCSTSTSTSTSASVSEGVATSLSSISASSDDQSAGGAITGRDKDQGGVKGWWKKKIASRPGTPTMVGS